MAAWASKVVFILESAENRVKRIVRHPELHDKPTIFATNLHFK